MFSFRTIVLIVMDGVGIGLAPDAERYNDKGADTLGHIAENGSLRIPTLRKLGLGNIRDFHGIVPLERPKGFYGSMVEISVGKGSTEGHWEIAGCPTNRAFEVFPDGFPEKTVREFSAAIGRKVLGNVPASGTEIIKQLGDEHHKTGYPILYTSADSVFQLAADETIVPLETLYSWCATAREMLDRSHRVVRVIARPFIRKDGKYSRTRNRKDLSVQPTDTTMLDRLTAAELDVVGIGKIGDLFANRGLKESIPTKNNNHGMDMTIEKVLRGVDGLVFVNLVDFDMLYGHRNDPEGFIEALEVFDVRLQELLDVLREDQLVIVTADHGCDPLFKGWNHTREKVPLLAFSPSFQRGESLGERETFADVSATVLENFSLEPLHHGTSFFPDLTDKFRRIN